MNGISRALVAASLTLVSGSLAQAQSFRSLFERVSKSVVVVRTLERGAPAEPGASAGIDYGVGSGTIISADGRILTAAHVIQVAERVGVELADGRMFPATVLGSSVRADVALIKIDDPPPDLVPARMGNADSVRVGDDVAIIGAPWGFSYSLTVGHVSRLPKPEGTTSGVPIELIQTDAAINHGNSGGPMFDMNGRVIGIVSHIMTYSGGSEGLGFAVSVNVAKRLLLSSTSVWTGIDGFVLNGELAKLFNLPQKSGLLVQRVAAGSPGAKLGLWAGQVPVKIGDQELVLGGDIVLRVGNIEVTGDSLSEDRTTQYVRALPPGAPLVVHVLRGGAVVELSAVLPR
ncbi:MAG: trypsin-like peptidase domain-containing protein [Gemmatimonadaceae bacterium]